MNFECPSDASEESKIFSIATYRRHPLKTSLYITLSLLSGFILPLITRWFPMLSVWVRYIQATSKDAEVLVITDAYGTKELAYMDNKPLYIRKQVSYFKMFDYRYQKYYYDTEEDMVRPVPAPFQDVTCQYIYKNFANGISNEATRRNMIMNYGKNIINVQLKSNIMIFVDEILSPFYIFQIFSVILWVFFENYVVYASIIFGTSTITMIITVFNIKKNLKAIKKEAEYITNIKVLRPFRDGHLFDSISSTGLVPGDIVEINANEPFPCDLVLMSGNVIVDESMLTGESIPVFKEPLESTDTLFSIEKSAKSILFAGTKCLDKKPPKNERLVEGLVLNIGFSTTRAKMIKSFLFTPPDKFSASKDSFKFIGGLAVFALAGFSASVSSMVDLGIGVREIIIKSLDLITTALPPALTTVLALGAEVSAKRLKLSNILAKSRSKINLAGQVDVMCFDKTGTLTEESLKLKEIHFKHVSADLVDMVMDRMLDAEISSQLYKFSPQLLQLMASCHSLTQINCELRGDPLELNMFLSTHWALFENNHICSVLPTNDNTEIYSKCSPVHILKRFDFVPELQRMSVVVEMDSDRSRYVYVKGSPEKLLPLCKKDTVPNHIWAWITANAKEGFRIVACAQKQIASNNPEDVKDNRDHYENDLEFLGLLNFENQLRPASLPNMMKFKEAGLRTVMLTGDNPLTSIHAARSCRLIQPDCDVILASLNKESGSLDVQYQLILNAELPAPKELFSPELQKIEVIEVKSLLLEEIVAPPPPVVKDQQLFKTVEMDSDLIEEVKAGKISLAITGETLNVLQKDPSKADLYKLFLKKGSIFSRMAPNEKAKVVESLMKEGEIVGMCGDGANDSAALKRAHVGLSIGNGEASLAAPFSTSIKDISSVDILLREGRAALCTSIQCFKYMAMYSVIQTTSMILLYLRRSNLTEWSFNYADMILNFPLAVGLSFSGPGAKLSRTKPENKLISRYVLSSVVGLGLLQSVFQIIIGVIIPRQSWYVHTNELHPHPKDYSEYNLNYDATCIFVFSTLQYISTAIAFSFGKPHRVSMLQNKVFTIVMLVTLTLSLCLIFADWRWIKVWLEHMIIPSDQFKWTLFGIGMANSVLNIVYEEICAYMHKRRTELKRIYSVKY